MVATKSNWQNITVIIFLSLHSFVICLKVTEISLKHRLCFTGIHQVKINVSWYLISQQAERAALMSMYKRWWLLLILHMVTYFLRCNREEKSSKGCLCDRQLKK